MRERRMSDLTEGGFGPLFIDILEEDYTEQSLYAQLKPLVLTVDTIAIFCTNMFMMKTIGEEIVSLNNFDIPIKSGTLRHIQFYNGCQIYLVPVNKLEPYIRGLRLRHALIPIEEASNKNLNVIISAINPGINITYYKDFIE